MTEHIPARVTLEELPGSPELTLSVNAMPKQGPDPEQVPFVEMPGSPRLYCGIGSRAIRTFHLDSMRLDDFKRLTLGQSLAFDPSMRAVSVRSLGPVLDSDGQPVPAIYGQQITVEVEYRHVDEKGK